MNMAQEWADHLAANNAFEHSSNDFRTVNGECVGENIYMASGGEASAIDATRSWYCEVDDYYNTINKWQNSPAIGHFTQVSGSQLIIYVLWAFEECLKHFLHWLKLVMGPQK